MTRLIDADKAERDIEELRESDWFNAPYLSKERKIGLSEAFDMIQSVCIKHAPPVDAVPVSYIQQRIDHLHELAEYEFEYNGGYIGATHIAWHELEKILIEWKEERDANQDKTD